ncbi:hypothetical protein BgAZ_109680 [Babesia gibsoni]|uniref:Uncharacterized protein n=1 Tax=Babesia gibsoni TaxID=33632 RepID=A0AAD8UV19_BABGI|nr:hypothetical protein BgAZ_109680 [Babesia gibsoni]
MATLRSPDGDKAPDSGELLKKDGSYLSHLVEAMMKESGVTHYDSRTVHLLVDILQRESLSLLQTAQEQSESRISQEKQMLLQDSPMAANLPKLNVRVSEEDAKLACQRYISDNIAKASFLQDMKEMQRYVNEVRLGVKTITLPSKQSRSLQVALKSPDAQNVGFYPTGTPPHLPDNIALNTLLPNWDLSVKGDKEERS